MGKRLSKPAPLEQRKAIIVTFKQEIMQTPQRRKTYEAAIEHALEAGFAVEIHQKKCEEKQERRVVGADELVLLVDSNVVCKDPVLHRLQAEFVIIGRIVAFVKANDSEIRWVIIKR